MLLLAALHVIMDALCHVFSLQSSLRVSIDESVFLTVQSGLTAQGFLTVEGGGRVGERIKRLFLNTGYKREIEE